MLSDTGRKLLDKITAYEPFNEQEERDRELILHALLTEEDVFTRDNALCHMTASAWIVNADRTKALMAYHNIYDSWSWLGGHADGEEDLLAVALKEAREEAGILNVRPVSDSILSREDGQVRHLASSPECDLPAGGGRGRRPSYQRRGEQRRSLVRPGRGSAGQFRALVQGAYLFEAECEAAGGCFITVTVC